MAQQNNKKNNNVWGQLSEDWKAEESGRTSRQIVQKPFEDEQMEVDFDISLVAPIVVKVKDDDSLGSDVIHVFRKSIRADPRPAVSYEEVLPPPPPIIPRDETKRFRVLVDFDEPEEKPIKERLGSKKFGLNPNQTSSNLEEGELLDDSLNDDEKDVVNLASALTWSAKLSGPRMKMYADEEEEKQKRAKYLQKTSSETATSSRFCHDYDRLGIDKNSSSVRIDVKRIEHDVPQQQQQHRRARDYNIFQEDYNVNFNFRPRNSGRIPIKDRLGHRPRNFEQRHRNLGHRPRILEHHPRNLGVRR